ncbi:hypothetical protein SCYAM73S_04554 [Streptomyces cyaneofuscatus]
MDIKTASALHRLRLISLPEALSFPALLIFGSLLMRVSDIDFLMPPLGMIHGVLFTIYVVFLLDVWVKAKGPQARRTVLPPRRHPLRRPLRRQAPEAVRGRRRHRRPRPPRGHGQRMIVAFSVSPLGVGEDVGEYVADAVRVVRESGLPNRTDAMFTSIEGEWDEVMEVVKRAVAAVEARAGRVSLVLKADIRPGVTDGLTSKVETVERDLAPDAPSALRRPAFTR